MERCGGRLGELQPSCRQPPPGDATRDPCVGAHGCDRPCTTGPDGRLLGVRGCCSCTARCAGNGEGKLRPATGTDGSP